MARKAEQGALQYAASVTEVNPPRIGGAGFISGVFNDFLANPRLPFNRLTPIGRWLGYFWDSKVAPLALNFADGTNTLDSRITFSRSSNATVTDSNGNIVFAPHNLLTFSEQFDNAAWSKTSGTVTANAGVAPDGTTTADQIASTGAGVFRSSITVTQGALHTASVYAKNVSGGSNFIFGFDSGPASGRTTFNLQNGTVVSNDANVVSSSITAVGNGWYRCVVSAVTTSTSCNLVYYNATSGANWLVWGAQLNQGSLQPYYPTTVKNLLGFSEAFENAAWTKSNSFIQTNLLTFSEQFDNAAWTKTNATVSANAEAFPNGSTTADKLLATAVSGDHVADNQFTATAGVTYTLSAYVKASELTNVGLRFTVAGLWPGGASPQVRFNLTDQTMSVVTGTPSSYSITPIGNGWFRCAMSVLCSVSGTPSARVQLMDGPNNVFTGTGSNGLFVWGAQVVQGASAGDYVQTTSAALPVMYQAPNGTMTADKLVETTANALHYPQQIVSCTSGTPIILSIYAKAAERTKIELLEPYTLRARVFNLSNGTVENNQTGVTNASVFGIENVGNGWYRCYIGVTTAGTSTALRVTISNGSATAYTGDGTSGVLIWGAQISDSASLDTYVNNPVAAPSSTAYYGPRFDYDPVTKKPRGLLIEEARTNLLLRSEEFDNASWTKARATISQNVAISPDGTQDADKLVEDTTASNSHFVEQSASTTNGITYTLSVYVKAAERSFVTLQYFIGTTYSNTFNLTTGVVTGGNGTGTITPVGNGWFRVTSTAAATATGTGFFDIFLNNGTTISYTGDGTSGLFLWGAQLEAGAFPTSYIPTTTATVTRAADVAVIQGTNFSSWYKYDEGTFLSEFIRNVAVTASVSGGFPRVLEVSDGTNNNNIRLQGSSNNLETMAVNVGGVDVVSLSFTQATLNTVSKLVGAYQVNNFATSLNGSAVQTDTSGAIPTVTAMYVGNRADGTRSMNGWIRRINYYNRRLDNSQLQAITQ